MKIPCPSKTQNILCVGLNYVAHAAEMKMAQPSYPMIFSKAATALIGHEQNIILTPLSKQIEYEGELVIVIGKQAKNISEANWRDVVSGFTCGNDVTARDLQHQDKQFFRSKSFDTFACIGPCVETDLDPSNLRLQTKINGVLKQDATTQQMLFSVPQIIAHITAFMTLHAGDLIYTGSPSGVGPLKSGDIVEVEIEGIGILRNTVN